MCQVLLDQNSFQVALKINLRASDEQIRRDFADWLDKVRSEQAQDRNLFEDIQTQHLEKYGDPKIHIPEAPPERLVAPAKLKAWCDLRILQYIDLWLWSQMRNVRLTNRAIANAVYPEGSEIDTVERVRKVLQPLAWQMLSSAFINALAAQAAHENSSQSSRVNSESCPQ